MITIDSGEEIKRKAFSCSQSGEDYSQSDWTAGVRWRMECGSRTDDENSLHVTYYSSDATYVSSGAYVARKAAVEQAM